MSGKSTSYIDQGALGNFGIHIFEIVFVFKKKLCINISKCKYKATISSENNIRDNDTVCLVIMNDLQIKLIAVVLFQQTLC